VFSFEVDDGTPLPPVVVAPPTAGTNPYTGPELKTVATTPGGAVLFLWTSESTHEHSVTNATLFARERFPDGTLGAVESVGTVTAYAAEATAGIEPVSGTAVALLTEHRIPGASPFRAFVRR
jgi:hypothetical protein